MGLGHYTSKMDTDSTPVFYSSEKLTVTGMRITSGSTVYPISAITTVEVLKRNGTIVVESLKIAALGALLAFSSAFMRGLLSLPPSLLVLMFLIAMLCIMAPALGVATYVLQRMVHICPSSGNSLTIRVWDKNDAFEMRNAVERAMTYHANAVIGGVPSVSDELNRLGALRSQGVISDSDWERAKDLFLGKRPDAQEQAIEQLRQLYNLHLSGVLSESEFNMKKWDILSRTQPQAAGY